MKLDTHAIVLSPEEITFLPLAPLVLCARADGVPSSGQGVLVLNAMHDLNIEADDVDFLVEWLFSPITQRDLHRLVGLAQRSPGLYGGRLLSSAVEMIGAASERGGTEHFSPRQRAVLLSIAATLLEGDIEKALASAGIPMDRDASKRLLDALWAATGADEPAEDLPLWPADRSPFGWVGDIVPIEGMQLEPAPLVQVDAEAFLRALARSVSVSRDEKRYVLATMPRLSQRQVDELLRIFEEERGKFLKLGPAHYPSLLRLQLVHGYYWIGLRRELMGN